jgi:hypothetical protein
LRIILFTENIASMRCVGIPSVLLWLLTLSSIVFAEVPNDHDKMLTVTNIEAVVGLNPNTGSWNFGSVNPLFYDDGSNYSLSHDFVLVNDNKTSLVIHAIHGSNFRVAYDLPDLHKSLPITIPPDGMITISIRYQLLPFVPGKLNGTLQVFTDHQAKPIATLQVNGIIRDPVKFDPPLLDFGTVKPGQEVTKSLKITYDQAMFPGQLSLSPEKLPRVTSDSLFVNVKQTAIGFTTRSALLDAEIANQENNFGFGARTELNQRDKDFFRKADSRREAEARRFLNTLPPLNNVVTYLITVKAPTEKGPFRGFVVILPVDGIIGTEVLKQESVAIQGEVADN